MLHGENDLVLAVEPIIKQAGDILLGYYNTALTRREKPGHGFVTEADLASERFLIKKLGALVPEASFFAEESGKTGRTNADYCWVIDPLDGTTNFACGLPYFCVSVALTYKNKPVFGMIYQPLLKELFYAVEGQGAYLNGNRIRVSRLDVAQSVIAVGLPYAKDTHYAHLLRESGHIAKKVYAIRHFGAVALDLAYLAAGRFEGVIFEELGWWDIAAGMVLVSEAGGLLSDFEGLVLTPEYRSCVATNSPTLQGELMKLLKTNV